MSRAVGCAVAYCAVDKTAFTCARQVLVNSAVELTV